MLILRHSVPMTAQTQKADNDVDAMEKLTFDLGGRWEFKEYPATARRMRDLEQGQWMPTTVPSSIFTGLIDAGRFSRFELESNPENFGWVSDCEWIYRRPFELERDFCDNRRIELVFEGLDTITQIWLNEKLIGKTENMFIEHRFEVGNYLHVGSNTLMVKFLSAPAHAERLMERYGKMSEHPYGDPRRPYVRKAQYQFGSGGMPALPGCGVFRPVRLEAYKSARLDEVYVRTIDCTEHYADIRVAASIHRDAGKNEPLAVKLTLGGGGLAIEQNLTFNPEQTEHTTVIRIDRPFFWWPAGYGVPHLYHLTAQLFRQDDTLLDKKETDFGVRSLHVQRGKDLNENLFQFEANEKPIYIKGATWMPLSMFPGSHSASDYEQLLRQLKQAHINMLRVWGGGYYEDDVFYQLCDKLGILVWQDFAFDSAYYPDRPWFLESVEREAQAVIRRLRNHACLALWCGNNRIDDLHENRKLGDGRKFYGRSLYHKLLPGLIRDWDPGREYLPTTPFSAETAKKPNTPTDGTCHYRDVGNNFAPTRDYLFDASQMPRFLAEFGLPSLPQVQCLERICRLPHLQMGSPELEKHNPRTDDAGRMAHYGAELFRPPQNLNEQIEQSQLVQARAAKLCVEHLRANNSVNSGLLLWTANDCVPAAGFSAIDVMGQPKALYYYARRFFAPIAITLEIDKHAWLNPPLKGNGIVVINETPKPLTATVRCRCLDFYGHTLDIFEYPISVGPFAKSAPRALPRAMACPPSPRRSLLHLEVVSEEGRIAENSFYYLPDKYIEYPSAVIDCRLTPEADSCWNLQLTAKTAVRDLTICPPVAAVVEDNYIDLLPNQPRQIYIQFTGSVPMSRLPVKLYSIPCGLT